jgi:cysteinyl-tRNA synthetase
MDALPWAPRYGTLAHRSLDEMLAGARVDVAPYKRDPMDFVLWKPSKPNEPGWPSPAGIAALGRPGWHIECSAMSMATLLEPFGGGLQCDDPSRNIFDIHGGGIDLVFPHHENEIAQSCCAFESSRMANVWMHNGFLQVEGDKMSKSLGNFVTIHELLRMPKFGGRKWSGEALRLAMLRTHYRQPIDWTVKALEEAEATLDRWYEAIGDVEADGKPDPAVLKVLSDDLNTHGALVRVHELANLGDRGALRASLSLLGFAGNPTKLMGRVLATGQAQGMASATGVRSVEVRFGITDAPDRVAFNVETTDASTLERIVELIASRNAARVGRNFAAADKIRDELASMGVAIKDNKDGTTSWEIKR